MESMRSPMLPAPSQKVSTIAEVTLMIHADIITMWLARVRICLSAAFAESRGLRVDTRTQHETDSANMLSVTALLTMIQAGAWAHGPHKPTLVARREQAF